MIELFCALLLTLCVFGGVLLRYAPFAPVVTRRQKKTLWICYIGLSAVNMVLLTAGMFAWGVECVFMYLRFGMILYAGLLTLVNILVISGKVREHLFVFGVVTTCNYLLMSVPNYIITFLPGYNPTEYMLLILLVYSLLLLLTFWPMRKLLCQTVEPFLHLQTNGYWNTIWFIPIALFGTRVLFAGGEHNMGSLLQLLSSGLSGSIIILMCLSISADHQRLWERQALEQQLTEQKIHYSELQTRVEDARKTRHDLKHHMAAILRFVEQEDREGARSYCMELMDRVEGRDQIPYTGNTAVDGVLYHYMQRAAAKQIDLQCQGIIRSHGIADMDLSVLLGNVLDNALAGCMTVPDGRRIQVISQSEEKLLSVVVRNTFDGKVKQGKDGLLSRKREDAYGIGLPSMHAVCQRYGGNLEYQWDEHIFTVVFILPLTK